LLGALSKLRGVRLQMQSRPMVGKSPLKVWPQPTHPLLARVQLALTFLWAAVPIPLIFAVIYIVFKGNIR